MPAQLADNFWPRPLRHCALPLVCDTDEEITIAEITSEPIDGFVGNRMLYTALVPLVEVDSVLKAAGGLRTLVWRPNIRRLGQEDLDGLSCQP
jgi:hypothetical protein